MPVRRPPKALRELCAQLRNHFDPDLLPSADAFAKNPAQVAAVRAQAAIFSADWPAAEDLGRKSVAAREEWYSGNFLEENLAALTFVALRTDTTSAASAWLDRWLAGELAHEDVSDYQRALLSRQVEVQKLAMAGEPAGLTTWRRPESPRPLGEFVEQLADKRPRVASDSLRGIDYMLYPIAEEGEPDDFVVLYDRVALEPGLSALHHITAARIHLEQGEMALARRALVAWRMFGWFPVEATDILPMIIFTYFDLYPLMTDAFLSELRDCPWPAGDATR